MRHAVRKSVPKPRKPGLFITALSPLETRRTRWKQSATTEYTDCNSCLCIISRHRYSLRSVRDRQCQHLSYSFGPTEAGRPTFQCRRTPVSGSSSKPRILLYPTSSISALEREQARRGGGFSSNDFRPAEPRYSAYRIVNLA